jgi:hypothetical protein
MRDRRRVGRVALPSWGMSAPLPRPPQGRAERFRYGPVEVDERVGLVRCEYWLDDQLYVETVNVGAGLEWSSSAYECVRLVHLLAGVSYYKAGAPRTIDVGDTILRPGDREFLKSFYVEGLGEFAYRNGFSLRDIEIVGGRTELSMVANGLDLDRPLVPFGGGIDSVVTADIVSRAYEDTALFIVSRRGDRFEVIETAAAATGLAVLRAEREIDARIARPTSTATIFVGHVPITGVLSSIAVLVAVLHRRGMVVMSNEWSASSGNLLADGHLVNHQFSKSEAFETAFREVLGALGPMPLYFSLLRPFSELWVAERFAKLQRFHPVVHSCNRAFHLDPQRRLDRWCGRCDKCCFIDLILAPFLGQSALATIFDGKEPLADPSLLPQFRALLGIGSATKPFECVGDIDECRTAAMLASARADRAGNAILPILVSELGAAGIAAQANADRLLRPLASHSIPDALFATVALD